MKCWTDLIAIWNNWCNQTVKYISFHNWEIIFLHLDLLLWSDINFRGTNQFKGQDPSLNLRLLLILKLSCHLFMSPDHFTLDQTYGFKINDHQSFFPQAYGQKLITALSWIWVLIIHQTRHIPEMWDHRAGCLLKTGLRSQSSILTA